MPKQRLVEPRDDFSGGLNTRQSQDRLQSNEVRVAENWRISDVAGALVKRTGTRRMHSAGLGAAVTGLYQWDAPGGKELVAVAGGSLYHKSTLLGEFTLGGSGFSTQRTQVFAPARENSASAPLVLYVADGNLNKWSGSAVTLLTGDYYDTSDPPNLIYSILDVDLVSYYHVRLFTKALSYVQTLYWSKLGSPEDFEVDIYEGGGAALVDVLRGEEIKALQIVGSSLMIATEDSVSRYTGFSNQDVQIAQDTEGVSPDVGVVGRQAFIQADRIGAMLTDRGLYAVTEAEALPLGYKVDPDFNALQRNYLGTAALGYHKGRKEIWCAVRGAGDTLGNQTVYVLSMGAVQGWSGPFTYPFGINCLAQYEDSNGDEWLVAGCHDGFVRLMDTGALDDVLSNGTGGSTYTATVELAPLFFQSGPSQVKTLERVYVEADIALGQILQMDLAMDNGPWKEKLLVGEGDGVQGYRVDAYLQGKRLLVRFVDSSSDIPVLYGLTAQAFHMQRG